MGEEEIFVPIQPASPFPPGAAPKPWGTGVLTAQSHPSPQCHLGRGDCTPSTVTICPMDLQVAVGGWSIPVGRLGLS